VCKVIVNLLTATAMTTSRLFFILALVAILLLGGATAQNDSPAKNGGKGDVCDSKKGFGSITQAQWVACKRSNNGNKNGRGPKGDKPKKCIKCAECPGLIAVNGKCEPKQTLSRGRRLFDADEDLWM